MGKHGSRPKRSPWLRDVVIASGIGTVIGLAGNAVADWIGVF
jgi:hypothetical protein